MKNLFVLLSAVSFSLALSAQQSSSTAPIIFIYDASGSMWGQIDGKTKMEIAADVLSNSTRSLSDQQQIGLVAYGHRSKGDCQDVEFLVDLDNTNKDQIVRSLDAIKPLGKTPLAYSARQVIDRLRMSGSRATIILITDGIESCDGDLCAVIKAAREEGLDFRLHIVGFGLKAEETEALKCAAAAGEGKYYDAADAGALTDGLREATHSTVDDPIGNFTVYAVKNGQAVDAHVEAFKAGTGTSVATARTYADTALLYLPAGSYDLKVRPLENSDVEAVVVPDVQSVVEKTTHQTVSFDGGTIKVSTFNNGEGWDTLVKINSDATGKSVSGGRTYGRTGEYELNPGLYDIELTAMKIDGPAATHRVENALVKANEEIDVEHHFQSGTAMIGARSGSQLVDAVVKINDPVTKKNVGGGRTYTASSSNPKAFTLTPGTYQVTLTALGDHSGKEESFTIEVKAGETVKKITEF